MRTTPALDLLRLAAFAALAVLGLSSLPALAEDGGCGEVSNCRRVTAAEDAALRKTLTALEAALPKPDPARWERAATSDGMAEKGNRPLFFECNPTWQGCFPSGTAVTIGYQAKGAAEKAAGKPMGDPGSMEALLAAAQAVADSMQYGVSLEIRLVPHPADNGCFPGEGYPRPVEETKGFLHEAYESDGERTASLVFGERACKEPDDYPTVGARTPLAPIRAVVVEVRGPAADVKALVVALDRKPFAAAVGPVVR